MKTILLAGATGYLGSYNAKELKKRAYPVSVIKHSQDGLKKKNVSADKTIPAELTQPESITGCCDQIDTVISTVGITRQKDGLSYMDVDYQPYLERTFYRSERYECLASTWRFT